jgi:uncharacterized protein (TIGR03437 family)
VKAADRLVFFGTGFGKLDPMDTVLASPVTLPANVRFVIGGVPAEVSYEGITSNGLYQFNVVVPALPVGLAAVVATIEGQASQPGLTVVILQ